MCAVAGSPIRLAAQDAALSRRKQGFDSPMGHQSFVALRRGRFSFSATQTATTSSRHFLEPRLEVTAQSVGDALMPSRVEVSALRVGKRLGAHRQARAQTRPQQPFTPTNVHWPDAARRAQRGLRKAQEVTTPPAEGAGAKRP